MKDIVYIDITMTHRKPNAPVATTVVYKIEATPDAADVMKRELEQKFFSAENIGGLSVVARAVTVG